MESFKLCIKKLDFLDKIQKRRNKIEIKRIELKKVKEPEIILKVEWNPPPIKF